MANRYYVQVQAARRLAEMVPIPEAFGVHPDLLMGLDEGAFVRGLRELHAVLGRLYAAMAATPDEFGLPLVETAAQRPTAKGVRDSDHSTYRVPNLLFCLGSAGTVVDGGLDVDREEFARQARAMRVRHLPPLVNKLGDAGFAFSHWNGVAFDRKVPRFRVAYPTLPAVMPVLRAAAVRAAQVHEGPAHSTSAHFYAMDYELFAGTGPVPPFDVADFRHLIGPEAIPFFDAYHRFMTERGYGYALDDGLYRFQYLDAKGKPTLDYFRCADYHYGERAGSTLLRIKLNHAGAYNDYVEACPEHVKQGFREAWRCQHCTETCGRRVTYRLDGELRESCICEAFAFFSPRLEDLPIYRTLFELEQGARSARGR